MATMKHRANYLIKNVGILTISNFSSKILVFLLVPLYTSVLTTEEYGTYDLVVSTVSVAFPILTINIVDAVMRFCMDKAYEKRDVITVGIKYILSSYVVSGIVALILDLFKIPLFSGNLVWLALLYYWAYAANQFMIQAAKGLERIQEMAVAGVLGTIVTLTANIFFLLVVKLGLLGFFLSNILSQAISAAYLLWRLKIWDFAARPAIDKGIQKEMLDYCVPLIVNTLGWWVNNFADKYTVVLMCGLAANGVLSVAYKIPSIINILQNIFVQAWQISAIKEYGEKDTPSFYGSIFTTVNFLMCAACAVLILLSKPLAGILFAKDFYKAWQYVPFLLISSVLNCASGFIGPILSAQKKSRSMAISAVYGSAVNVVLNIMLVYTIGVQGATIATAVSSYVIYVMRWRAAGKDIAIENYHLVIISWCLLYVQAIVEIYTVYWYFEIGLIFMMIVANRKEIRIIICRLISLAKK